MPVTRHTRYSNAVLRALKRLGHATNGELLSELQKTYPAISATTIHRITKRLGHAGTISTAPNTLQGAARFDANLTAHDHFMCLRCENLKDISIPREYRALIQQEIGSCAATGPLTITGNCQACNKCHDKPRT